MHKDTTSDSVVARDVEVCLLLTQANGKNVLRPYSIKNPPEVDLPDKDPQQNPNPHRDGVRAVQGYVFWCRLNDSEVLN